MAGDASHIGVMGIQGPAGGPGVFESCLALFRVAEGTIPLTVAGTTGCHMVDPGFLNFGFIGLVASAAAVAPVAIHAIESEMLDMVHMMEGYNGSFLIGGLVSEGRR